MTSHQNSTLAHNLRRVVERLTRQKQSGETQRVTDLAPRVEPGNELELVQALHDTAAEMRMTDDFDQAVDRILAHINQVVPFDLASILLVETDQVRVVRSIRPGGQASKDPGPPRPVQQIPHLLRAMTTGHSVVIADTKVELGWEKAPETDWIRSHISVPIQVGKETLGFVDVDSATPDFFNPAYSQRLQAFVDQAALTLENIRLATASQRSIRELGALNRIQASINSTLEVDWVLQLTMQEVQDLFGVEKCSLMLVDEQTNELFFQVALGTRPDKQIRFNVDQGIAGWVVRTGQPALVNDVRADPRWFSQPDALTGFTTRSILAFPLKARDKVIGVIELINKVQGVFTVRELELLDSIANSVAGAIENARLFGELNKAYQGMARTQSQIIESRNTLRTVFDGIDDSIYILGEDLSIKALNRSGATEMGVEPRFGIGRYCYEVLDQSDKPCDQCPVIDTFKSGKPTLVTQSRMGRGGTQREFEIRTYPQENPDGVIDRVIEIVRDVTEKQKMEATLVQSAKLSALGELAAGVAHEINNPLTAVYGNAQMLLRALEPEDARYQMAQLIERAGLRASKVVRNLLDFSRQEDYQFVPTDLNSTIDDALSLILHQLQRDKIAVTKDLKDNLPLVSASTSHLQTVWTNLLINARDAIGEQPGGTIKITTRQSEDGHLIQALFTDNGPGIAEKDLPRIFEAFFTTKPRGRGSGLGLYVSYMIIAHHRGTMQVSSRVGEGTTFIANLPIESA